MRGVCIKIAAIRALLRLTSSMNSASEITIVPSCPPTIIANGMDGFKHDASFVSIAHELSGLGSTRVVRFCASGWRRINEPGDVAAGPENAEVSGRFEPLGTAGAVDDGGRGAAGNVGAPVSALPGSVRGRRRSGSDRPPVGQALAQAHRGRRGRSHAGAVP